MENPLSFVTTDAELFSAIIEEHRLRRGWSDQSAQINLDRLYHHYKVGLNAWLDRVWREKVPSDVVALLAARNPIGAEKLKALGYGFGIIDVSQKNSGEYTYVKHVAYGPDKRFLAGWVFEIRGFRAVNQEAKAEIQGTPVTKELEKPKPVIELTDL